MTNQNIECVALFGFKWYQGVALGVLGWSLVSHFPDSDGKWRNPKCLLNEIAALPTILLHLEQVQYCIRELTEEIGKQLVKTPAGLQSKSELVKV